jgi:hypothetical protein
MQQHQSPSMAQYSQWLSESGISVLPGSQGTAWKEIGTGSVMRLPMHATNVPTSAELRNIFSHNYFIARYLIEPDERHPATRWLYIADRDYDVQKLGRSARGSIRHAQRCLRFTDLSWDELRQHGEPAYCQTNARHKQPEITPEAFHHYVDTMSQNAAHHALGAWLGDRLIAFSLICTVDDWVEGIGRCSTDADRNCRPNEGLYHYIMERFLVQGSCRVYSVGVGNTGEQPGLHPFKLKVGFKAIPVHDAVGTPVWARPLLNPIVLSTAKAVLRLRPHNRLLFRTVRTLDQIVHPPLLPADQAKEVDEI